MKKLCSFCSRVSVFNHFQESTPLTPLPRRILLPSLFAPKMQKNFRLFCLGWRQTVGLGAQFSHLWRLFINPRISAILYLSKHCPHSTPEEHFQKFNLSFILRNVRRESYSIRLTDPASSTIYCLLDLFEIFCFPLQFHEGFSFA